MEATSPEPPSAEQGHIEHVDDQSTSYQTNSANPADTEVAAELAVSVAKLRSTVSEEYSVVFLPQEPSSSVTSLLLSIKDLLESLDQWSQKHIHASGVSDVYVRMEDSFNAVVAAFQASGVDMSALLDIPQELRYILEETLAEGATPNNLEAYLPRIRLIVQRLLRDISSKQDEYKKIKLDSGARPETVPIISKEYSPSRHGISGKTIRSPKITDEITSTMANSHGDHIVIGQPWLRKHYEPTRSPEMQIFEGLDDETPKYSKHAARELYTWSKCQHPNIQRLLGLVQFRGQIGMVSEWVPNGNLLEYVSRHPDVNRYVLSKQLSDGLSYLHGFGVIHGDLKGANVLISGDGIPLLTDFGNAELHQRTLQFSITGSQTSISVRWAAPEILQGIATCSVQGDIYALGMTILEAFTGTIPYPKKNEAAVMFAVVIAKAFPERPETHIPQNSEHGDALWSLLEWCWAFEPEKRPSASEVKARLDHITQSGLRTIPLAPVDVVKAKEGHGISSLSEF
ncbi:Ephrin type-A receptor 4 [Ceratobasidium sp. AG-Ba]|nr:Ephrin type-A receptor 4 [Ceratobasidium sp. AG-Ba]